MFVFLFDCIVALFALLASTEICINLLFVQMFSGTLAFTCISGQGAALLLNFAYFSRYICLSLLVFYSNYILLSVYIYLNCVLYLLVVGLHSSVMSLKFVVRRETKCNGYFSQSGKPLVYKNIAIACVCAFIMLNGFS